MSASFRKIAIENYNYELPDERIAKYPAEPRDESKLLHFAEKKISTYSFKQLPDLLEPDDLLVFNNAKVIQARLGFEKETGALIEIFCLEPHNPSDYNQAFQVKGQCEWKCLVGNLKKWKTGKLQKKITVNGTDYIIEASKLGKEVNAEIIHIRWFCESESKNKELISFGDILEQIGHTPLPPYLNREANEMDKLRYQTVYAKQQGSVAAPTAGLHFSDLIFERLRLKGIQIENLTLHVSAGTFRPVKSNTIDGHEMHMEHFEIDLLTLKSLMTHKGRIISVGTTSARTLESLHRIGFKLINGFKNPFHIEQWEVYDEPDDSDYITSFQAIVNYMETNNINRIKATTSIIIVPGYQFKTIQGIVTNFHQPQSTLLLLIAAAVGEEWRSIYKYALANDFRFLSYGDSSLLVW